MSDFSLHTTLRSAPPHIAFATIKTKILTNHYDLSLVLIGDALGKRLNKEHKGRDYPTNILSFPLSEHAGEIFINMRRAQRDAKKFNHTVHEHITYLFIHGCLHLAGHAHGSTMDALEQKFLAQFNTE